MVLGYNQENDTSWVSFLFGSENSDPPTYQAQEQQIHSRSQTFTLNSWIKTHDRISNFKGIDIVAKVPFVSHYKYWFPMYGAQKQQTHSTS
jgi:hypothetical protein